MMEGQPFTISNTGLDAQATQLLQTRTGQAVGTLGRLANDPSTEAKVPANARDIFEVLGVIAIGANAGTPGTVSAASSDCIALGTRCQNWMSCWRWVTTIECKRSGRWRYITIPAANCGCAKVL
jgi:hypothetical protein